MRHYTREQWTQVFEHFLGDPLPNVIPQPISEVSAVKRHKIGARLQIGNRVYHYARCGGGQMDSQQACFIRNAQDSYGVNNFAADAAAGATALHCVLAAGQGPAQNGNLPLNYLEGGTITMMSALGINIRGILSNTPVVGGLGGNFWITLDVPISTALVMANAAYIIASRYAEVCDSIHCRNGARASLGVGIASLITPEDYYVWLQTWGPCYVQSNLTLGVGDQNKAAYFVGDGNVQDQAGLVLTGDDGSETQRAGVFIAQDMAGGQGNAWIQLELDP